MPDVVTNTHALVSHHHRHGTVFGTASDQSRPKDRALGCRDDLVNYHITGACRLGCLEGESREGKSLWQTRSTSRF